LAAHAEAEHGIELDEQRPSPLVAAIASGLLFVIGAMIVVVAVVVTPSTWRVPTTFVGCASVPTVGAGGVALRRTRAGADPAMRG
jgi:VIT1/CCC1 family predicted Fe2+/Mn2+ transporter